MAGQTLFNIKITILLLFFPVSFSELIIVVRMKRTRIERGRFFFFFFLRTLPYGPRNIYGFGFWDRIRVRILVIFFF